jgi:hypothetical protein
MAIISAIILATYLLVMALTCGVREYVSDNYYIGRHPWVFSLVLGISGGLLLPAMLDKGGNFQALALFAVFGLMMVAISPHYKVDKMHSVGALIALVSGVLWVVSFHPYITLLVIAGWLIYWKFKMSHPYYIGEVLAFILIYYTTIF